MSAVVRISPFSASRAMWPARGSPYRRLAGENWAWAMVDIGGAPHALRSAWLLSRSRLPDRAARRGAGAREHRHQSARAAAMGRRAKPPRLLRARSASRCLSVQRAMLRLRQRGLVHGPELRRSLDLRGGPIRPRALAADPGALLPRATWSLACLASRG